MAIISRPPPAARLSQSTLRLVALIVALGVAAAVIITVALALYGSIATGLSYRLLLIGDVLLIAMIVSLAFLILSLIKFIESRIGVAMPPRPPAQPPPPPQPVYYHQHLLQPPRTPQMPPTAPTPAQPQPPQPRYMEREQERAEEPTTPSVLLKPVSKRGGEREQEE